MLIERRRCTFENSLQERSLDPDLVVMMQRAIEVGADFIETDILATKDGKLICFHDVTLDATTNVANLTQFADRKRTYSVQGENVTGFFTGPLLPCALCR